MMRNVTILPAALLLITGCFGKDAVPVDVTFKDGKSGKVAVYVNSSAKPLPLQIMLVRPSVDRVRAFTLQVAANQSLEQGPGDGWSYRSGDTITISCEGFGDRKITVP